MDQKDSHLQNSRHVDDVLKNGRDNLNKILFSTAISLHLPQRISYP
jgi:hypothetical protein